jgi:hypothetical protein
MSQSPLYQSGKDDVDRLIEHYRGQLNVQVHGAYELTSGGPVNWVDVLTRFVASAIQVFAGIQGSGPDQRQAVIDAGLNFYKQVLEPVLEARISHPLVFNNFIEPAIEKALPGVVGGLYDALAKILTGQNGAPARPPAGTDPPDFRPY